MFKKKNEKYKDCNLFILTLNKKILKNSTNSSYRNILLPIEKEKATEILKIPFNLIDSAVGAPYSTEVIYNFH